MIISEQETKIEISEEVEEIEYVIKADKEAFRTLAKTIYSHPIKSPIRELCTNAYDAHVAAGKADVPFAVHLPNTFEPYFSVKDDGIGLSDEQIRGVIIEIIDEFGNKIKKRKNGIYTTFFDSNKTNSNDFTGCLGLGSKSPFGYTDQFSIESRFNGIKTVYNSFINKAGRPAIAKLGEIPTNESNGVEIKFAVKSSDFSSFATEANNILRWFKVKPTVLGIKNFVYPSPKYLLEKEKYQLFLEQQNTSNIIMGNICYPININSLYQINLDTKEMAILRHGCNLYVPIGSVNITANRESINYDKQAEKTIKEVLKLVIDDTAVIAQDEVKNAKTKWEVRKIIHKNTHSLLFKLHGNSTSNISWNGTKLGYELTLPQEISGLKTRSYGRRKYDEVNIISPDRKIYIDDLNKGGLARVKQANDTYGSSSYILYVKKATHHNFDIMKWAKEEGLDADAVLTSSLPKVNYDRTGVSFAKEYSTVYRYNFSSSSGAANRNWETQQLDLKCGGVYVEINRFYVVDKKGVNRHPVDFKKVIEAVNTLYNVPVYGIRGTDIERMNKKYPGKWSSLEEYCKKIISDQKVIDAIKLYYNYANLSNNGIVTYYDPNSFRKNSPFRLFLEKCRVAKKEFENKNNPLYIEMIRHYDATQYTDIVDLEKERNAIFNQYPLMNFLQYYSRNAHIADYINLIDEKNGVI